MQRVLIIGFGLIGGSFARALKANKIAKEIYVYDFDIDAIEMAKKEKIVEGFCPFDKKFDLIVIATPLSAYEDVIENVEGLDLEGSTILDLGSVKEFVIDLIPDELQEKFVLCHPIAGSDRTGFENSSVDLFLGKKFIICSKNSSTKIVENIIIKIGGKPEFIEAHKHDEIYALVSHLPQFLSFLTKENSPKNLENSFLKNAFRLDNSGPEIWEDIFDLNEENLEKFYLEFFNNLEEFAELLKRNEIEKLSQSLKTLDKTESSFLQNDINHTLLFRMIIVASYLKIAKIKEYQSFAGSGFKDFTSIMAIAQNTNLEKLLQENRAKILKMIEGIN